MVNTVTLLVISSVVEMTWGLRLIVGYVVIIAAATAGITTA